MNNRKAVYSNLGARNLAHTEREKNDYYATEPRAVELLVKLEKFDKNILEPACGGGHISEVLKKNGYNVTSLDLIDRGYGIGGEDFLQRVEKFEGDIITNPPFKFAKEFVEKSLEIISEKNKVAMFLKIQFLEGKQRKKLFEKFPPKIIYISSSRLKCAINGNFEGLNTGAIAYGWFIWEKGYKGETIIKWFN